MVEFFAYLILVIALAPLFGALLIGAITVAYAVIGSVMALVAGLRQK